MIRHAVFGACLASALLACSTGGGRADFDLKTVPGTPVFEAEKDYASTVLAGRYRLVNNVWNKGATTGRYRQKIFVNDDHGKPVFGWVWKWRDSSGVATYPEVQVGVSPWNGEAAPDSGFPFQAGTKKLVVSYDVDLQATGAYNLAFEFWAVARQPVTQDTVTHEVMIWIAGRVRGWDWKKTCRQVKLWWFVSGPSSSIWHRRVSPRRPFAGTWTISGRWAGRSSATCTTPLL